MFLLLEEKEEDMEEDCVQMGCPNKATHYQELDDPAKSTTNDGRDWYCSQCFKDCVDDGEED